MVWTELLPEGTVGIVGGPADFAELTDLMHRHDRAIEGSSASSVEGTEHMFQSPEFDPSNHWVSVRDDGKLVAAAIFDQRPPNVSSFTQVWVDPDNFDRGLGSAIARWAIDLGMSRIDLAPNGAQVKLAMGAHASNHRAVDVLERHNFSPERYFLEMTIELDQQVEVHPFPGGLEPRKLSKGEDITPLAAAVADAFKDHFGYTEAPLEQRVERWNHWRTGDDWDDDLVWISEEGEEIAGFNVSLRANGSKRDEGYVASLGVRRAWRGRGLARALLTAAFAEYQRRGLERVSLHVDADSLTGATRLYEGVGMHESQRYVDYELELREGEDLVVR